MRIFTPDCSDCCYIHLVPGVRLSTAPSNINDHNGQYRSLKGIGASEFTISFWVKPKKPDLSNQYELFGIMKDGDTNPLFTVGVYNASPGNEGIYIDVRGDNDVAGGAYMIHEQNNPNKKFVWDQWNHVVFNKTGHIHFSWELYCNKNLEPITYYPYDFVGVNAPYLNNKYDVWDIPGKFRFGSMTNNLHDFKLAQWRLYRKNMKLEDVIWEYHYGFNHPSTKFKNDLAVWFPFNNCNLEGFVSYIDMTYTFPMRTVVGIGAPPNWLSAASKEAAAGWGKDCDCFKNTPITYIAKP